MAKCHDGAGLSSPFLSAPSCVLSYDIVPVPQMTLTEPPIVFSCARMPRLPSQIAQVDTTSASLQGALSSRRLKELILGQTREGLPITAISTNRAEIYPLSPSALSVQLLTAQAVTNELIELGIGILTSCPSVPSDQANPRGRLHWADLLQHPTAARSRRATSAITLKGSCMWPVVNSTETHRKSDEMSLPRGSTVN